MTNSADTHILSVAVPRPLDSLFTYRVPNALLSEIRVGGWVRVPFGRGVTHAFVVEPPKPLAEIPAGFPLAKLKDLIEVGDTGPIFTEEVMALCRWASDYYRAPLGEVLHCAAPPAALGLRSARKKSRRIATVDSPPLILDLTEAQQAALKKLQAHRDQAPSPRVALLHGVTGSGKTELYLALAREALAQGKGVLLLVPEIALTPQLHERFERGLGTAVGLWHSALADGKRRDQLSALLSGELRVVVGARSAVFAPIRNLGLIVIDEEHDSTYKQEDRVRYHARDLAVVRAKISGAFVVLGSATPSLETRERAREGKYGLARLSERIAAGGMPKIEIIDLAEEPRVEGLQAPFAEKTLTAIRETLAAGQQVMIFLNRRGFASFLICEDCGEVSGCPECSISLTVHRKAVALRCHVCGHQERIPDACGKCHGATLTAMGAGTESLEEELPGRIEGMIPLRLDRDQVTSATRLGEILEAFRRGEGNTLLGTQMLVKGHDFPGVTLVVVVLADALFRWPDFRAPERALQILTQVSGRAGRGEHPGRVLIQTFNPQHPVIQTLTGAITEDDFLESERELRKVLGYPPFGRLARLRFESDSRDEARSRAQSAAQEMEKAGGPDRRYEVLGPSEAFLEKAKGIFRWDLLIKSPDIQSLQNAVHATWRLCGRNRWPFLVDIDPNGVG